jgi:hypothetical protein
VRARIFVAAAAWLLGAATATGGCLLAVSLLGDGLGVTGSSGQQLTAGAVNKALAAAEREPASPPATTSRPARPREPATRRPRAARPTPTQTPTLTPPPPTPTFTPTPAQSTTPAGTPLSSQAGTVIATCESAGAYLLSWTPAQGYEVDQFARGPASVASVRFEANSTAVTMNISCPGGPGSTPVSSTTTSHDE